MGWGGGGGQHFDLRKKNKKLFGGCFALRLWSANQYGTALNSKQLKKKKKNEKGGEGGGGGGGGEGARVFINCVCVTSFER